LIDTDTDDEPPKSVHEASEIIPIDEFLGLYDHEKMKIVIFNKGIEWASGKLNCYPELLRYIVKVHEWAHAILHVGVDQGTESEVIATKFDPEVTSEIYRKQGEIYESIEYKVHEVLAQLLTYHSLQMSKEKATKRESKMVLDKMIELFLELSKHQPREYRVDRYLDVPLERLSESIHLIRKGWLKGIFDAWNTVIAW
jgi:hypothetical protein